MSLNKSLKERKGNKKKNVLTRLERIKDLIKKKLWKKGDKVTKLDKTKVKKERT